MIEKEPVKGHSPSNYLEVAHIRGFPKMKTWEISEENTE